MMSMDIVATHHAVLRRSILPDFAIWRSCCNGSTVTLNRLNANISGYRRYNSVFEAAEDRGDTEGWRDRGAKVIFVRTHTARTHTYASHKIFAEQNYHSAGHRNALHFKHFQRVIHTDVSRKQQLSTVQQLKECA